MAKFQARFYRVTHCGYYGWGDANPSLGGLAPTLEALQAWSQGMSLLETRMEGAGESLPSYLFDIRRHGSCWVLTLWNEVPAEDGKISSVMGTDLVGGADVYETELMEGSIPGFPTYAVFYPEEGIYVALKHSDVIAGTQQLKNYLGTYLGRSSPWVRVDDTDPASSEILGYLEIGADDDEISAGLSPRFGIQVIRKGDQRAEMIRNVDRIRKLIRVKEVPTLNAPDRAAFQRLLTFLGLEAEPRSKCVRIRQEIPVRMGRDQLVATLNAVEEELEPKKNDLAVMYEKDPQVHWLSGMIPHQELDIAVERDGAVFPAERLARSLSARREQLMAVIGQ